MSGSPQEYLALAICDIAIDPKLFLLFEKDLADNVVNGLVVSILLIQRQLSVCGGLLVHFPKQFKKLLFLEIS